MDYTQKAPQRPHVGIRRKLKRVSDESVVGPAVPQLAPQYISAPYTNAAFVNTTTINNDLPAMNPSFSYTQTAAPQPQANQPSFPEYSNVPNSPQQRQPAQPFVMFQQPIVQDMAMQYGQQLADHGKQMVESQLNRWIPVAQLRYYFAVDNNYVINKLRLLFFPYTHRDWSLKYDQDNPVQPRYDINAPDLYIPSMAYITYVVVAGLMLGIQDRFSPEQLGIQASSALAYNIFELAVYLITLYVLNIKTNLKTLDLLAFSGYKYVIIVACLLASSLFYNVGYYATFVYSTITLSIFLLRTLKTKVLQDAAAVTTGGPINYDPYGNPQQFDYGGERKRKLYFLLLVIIGQALVAFFLSKHLFINKPSASL